MVVKVEERVEEESKTRVGDYGGLWGLRTFKWVKNIREFLREYELVSTTQTPSNSPTTPLRAIWAPSRHQIASKTLQGLRIDPTSQVNTTNFLKFLQFIEEIDKPSPERAHKPTISGNPVPLQDLEREVAESRPGPVRV